MSPPLLNLIIFWLVPDCRLVATAGFILLCCYQPEVFAKNWIRNRQFVFLSWHEEHGQGTGAAYTMEPDDPISPTEAAMGICRQERPVPG